MGFFVLLFLFWIPLALYTAKVAQTKGCSTGPWLIGGFLFGPVALLSAVGWPDLVQRRYIRLLAEQQGVARDDLTGHQPAPTADTPDLYPRLGEDPNKPKGLLGKLDDVMDPDRES